ncbi:hypothetical protein [Pseudomonas coronafaciens]|uniref:hypothetical protein n=1 Tax=Pseudomonas coronafaciens TaxID=53409 RepID=UPI0013C376A5|nr:hypothetical protein [Pseudomonas coronafaciens]
MVTHYGIEGDRVACGRNNHKLVSVRTPGRVTCKACRSSETYRAASAAAEDSLAFSEHIKRFGTTAKGKTEFFDKLTEHFAYRQSGLGWKDAWVLRLGELGVKNRLPRGFNAKQLRARTTKATSNPVLKADLGAPLHVCV